MTETPPEIDPEQLAQWEKYADDLDWQQQMKRRQARDFHYFLQGLATGIAGTVILAVVVWTLWP